MDKPNTKESRDFEDILKEYVPCNEQEQKDKELILTLFESCKGDKNRLFYRENNFAHMSASAWVVNRSRDKVLMAYHNIFDSWAWTGGHADGETDLLSVAVREVKEETGIKNVVPVTEKIFSVEVLTVDGHEKRGSYVSSHLHLNITYLLEADDQEAVRNKEDENSAVGWFDLKDCLEAVSEPWMGTRIYQKLLNKRTEPNY